MDHANVCVLEWDTWDKKDKIKTSGMTGNLKNNNKRWGRRGLLQKT